MKPILNRAQSRQLDQRLIDACAVPSLILMENAGRGAAEVIRQVYPHCAKLLVVCGSGNNGGDGLVLARQFLTWNRHVRVWLTTPGEQLRGDALIQFRAYHGVGGSFDAHVSRQQLQATVAESDVVVDAIFGTGLTRDVTGIYAEIIDALNGSGKPVVALDLPSGLDADRGTAHGVCIRAAHTVTFGFAKLGHFATLAQSVVGTLHVADLGVPAHASFEHGPAVHEVEEADVRQVLLGRANVSHKGQAGHVLLLAGAQGTVGAARLAADGALRMGAGLVTLAARAEVASALESTAREVMVRALSTSDTEESLKVLRGLLSKADTVVMGPGWGVDETAKAWADCVLAEFTGTVVVDADGLSLFGGRTSELADAHAALVLTPHPGEAARLLGCTTADVEADRFGSALELAKATRSVVVLKGGPSLIATHDRVWVSARGHECMSTAGAGDVLTGIIAALAGQLQAAQAAWVGSYLHARAGAHWANARGTSSRGMLARELAYEVPTVVGAILAK